MCLLALGKFEDLPVMLAVIMLLDHLVSTLFTLLLLIEKQNDLHASFGLINAKLLRQTIQGHEDQLTNALNVRQGFVARW